jgi:hypothetical protein
MPPAASGSGWFSRLIEVAGLISRARDFLVQFQHGRRSADTSDNSIEQLERDLHNYQLTVAMDDLLPIRDNKLFDKSKVVYLLLSYVYISQSIILTLVQLSSFTSLGHIMKIRDVLIGFDVSTLPRKQCPSSNYARWHQISPVSIR